MDNMEVPTTTFVDSHSGQQFSHTNPIEKNRQPTDKLFIFIFILILIAWFGVCISVLASGLHGDRGPNNIGDDLAAIIIRTDSDMDELFSRYNTEIIISLVLGSIGTLYCIFLNSKITNFSIYLGSGLSILVMIYTVVSSSSNIGLYIPYCLQLMLLILWIVSLLAVDESVVFDVIKDACRIVVFNPSIILITCLISILELLVVLFTWKAVIQYLLLSRGEYYMSYGYVVVIMLCGGCVVSFLFNFAVMIITDYTVNYYWKNASIVHTLDRVLRNHMGTIAFSSMLFTPFFCTLVQAVKHKRTRKHDENIVFYYASKLFLVFNMSWNALAFSSIYGTGFVKSTQKTFDTLLRHYLLYLATLGAAFALCAIDTAGICISVMSGALTYMKNIQDPTSDDIIITLYLVLYVMMYPILTFTLALHSSAEALLVNIMIMLSKEDQCTEGMDEILNQ